MGNVKNKLRTLITANENLSGGDRIYLRTVLKLDNIYAAVLNHEEYEIPNKAKDLDIDVERLNRLLCRLTRKYLTKIETFINTEINRMLASEKPGKIVITRPLTVGRTKLPSKSANRKMTRSFNGYIRERLAYKCRIYSIELVEINSKGTGSICSCCGAQGKRTQEGFVCPNCGYKASISLNGAKNIENKWFARQNYFYIQYVAFSVIAKHYIWCLQILLMGKS